MLAYFCVELYRFYNHPLQCQLNATAYFHSWRAGHCFVTGESSSFMMTEDGLEMTYNNTLCSTGGLTNTEMLSTTCEAADTGDKNDDDDKDADVLTGLRVTYAVFDGKMPRYKIILLSYNCFQ